VIFKIYFRFPSLNPELVICNLDPKIKLFRFNNRKGRGYVPAEENKKNAAIGTILQILFYSGKNVKYAIENFRVEQKTDYEKLVLK
jgi:DNA-directed RNA polymerase subunit alpha